MKNIFFAIALIMLMSFSCEKKNEPEKEPTEASKLNGNYTGIMSSVGADDINCSVVVNGYDYSDKVFIKIIDNDDEFVLTGTIESGIIKIENDNLFIIEGEIYSLTDGTGLADNDFNGFKVSFIITKDNQSVVINITAERIE